MFSGNKQQYFILRNATERTKSFQIDEILTNEGSFKKIAER